MIRFIHFTVFFAEPSFAADTIVNTVVHLAERDYDAGLLRESLRGAWRDDDDRSECAACGRQFNMVRWKHHCRVCGDIFCDACSRNRLVTHNPRLKPSSSTEDKERVCDAHFDLVESLTLAFEYDLPDLTSVKASSTLFIVRNVLNVIKLIETGDIKPSESLLRKWRKILVALEAKIAIRGLTDEKLLAYLVSVLSADDRTLYENRKVQYVFSFDRMDEEDLAYRIWASNYGQESGKLAVTGYFRKYEDKISKSEEGAIDIDFTGMTFRKLGNMPKREKNAKEGSLAAKGLEWLTYTEGVDTVKRYDIQKCQFSYQIFFFEVFINVIIYFLFF